MVVEVKAAGDVWNYSGTFLRGSSTIKILAPALWPRAAAFTIHTSASICGALKGG